MNIVGISGSPTRDGNNEKMIEMALAVAEDRGFEVDRIFLSERTVAPCTACGDCTDKKVCTIEDGMAEIYPLLEDADGIIVATPVYFGCMTAQLKAIAVGGSRNGGQEKTVQAIHDWMHIHGMIVVGDNSHFGGLVHAPAESDEVGMQTVRDTIGKICDVLGMIKR
jgi:multimeric flavodoxin WrbA